MRTIILIQTLIIVAGAFYIYYFTKEHEGQINKTDTPNMIIPAANIENVRTGYVPPTENPPSVYATTTLDDKVTPGHSDAGMEFPSLDEEITASNTAVAN